MRANTDKIFLISAFSTRLCFAEWTKYTCSPHTSTELQFFDDFISFILVWQYTCVHRDKSPIFFFWFVFSRFVFFFYKLPVGVSIQSTLAVIYFCLQCKKQKRKIIHHRKHAAWIFFFLSFLFTYYRDFNRGIWNLRYINTHFQVFRKIFFL